MNKGSIFRKIENKKPILTLGVSFIVLTTILVLIIVPLSIYFDKPTESEKLYKNAKSGIFFEDLFLEHAIWEPCGENCYSPKPNRENGGIIFKIYAKVGDWYHFHYKSKVISNVWFEYNGTHYRRGISVGHSDSEYGYSGYETDQFRYNSIYTVGIYNFDSENSGTINFFFIVYTNEDYPPDCPFC